MKKIFLQQICLAPEAEIWDLLHPAQANVGYFIA
jgi:hypothetical protein